MVVGRGDLHDVAVLHVERQVATHPAVRADGVDLRAAGDWREEEQTEVETVCPYCGVGCNLTLHVQDDAIVNVTSPDDHDVTRGNLCIKGRFGYRYVQNRGRRA